MAAPAGQKDPDGHVLQSLGADLPWDGLYVPPGHCLGAGVPPGQKDPAGHCVGLDALLPQYDPAGHCMGMDDPLGQYVPSGQELQFVC